MHTVLMIVHVVVAIGLIVLVLIQHGRGADAGAAFGSGASATVFGARGSASFLTRATATLATVFFVTSLWLAQSTLQRSNEARRSVVDRPAAEAVEGAGEVQKGPADVPALPVKPAGSDVPKAN